MGLYSYAEKRPGILGRVRELQGMNKNAGKTPLTYFRFHDPLEWQ